MDSQAAELICFPCKRPLMDPFRFQRLEGPAPAETWSSLLLEQTERLFNQGSNVVPEEGIFLMTLSVHAFSPASPAQAFLSFPSSASLSFSLSDNQRGSRKNVRRRLPGSHSNFLLSRLSGEQPNAGLQKAAAARNTTCIIEFAAVTYVNLSYVALPWRPARRHLS